MKKLKCIMLIDDNPDDNFFHKRIINKGNFADTVVTMESASDGLAFITSKRDQRETYPDLIFLDINMPGMSGWDFLVEYDKLNIQLPQPVIIVMLTTSDNPDDKMKAKSLKIISSFKTKPLSQLMLEEVLNEYFKE